MRRVYLDNAATTAVSREVFRAMKPFLGKKCGNPSQPHTMGKEARVAVEEARKKIARLLGAEADEVIFTCSATESINLFHKGLVEAILMKNIMKKKPHIITTAIEHKAVIESCKHLEKSGAAEMTYLPVDQWGVVQLMKVEEAIREETVLISIMYVNNEVGTIQLIEAIGEIIKRKGRKIYFHTDATQAVGYLDCDVRRLGVDSLSLTGHKINAPKGVGALYVKRGTPLVRQQDGGGQERGMRGGTENVPGIVGLGEAVEQVRKNRVKDKARVEKLREWLIRGVLKNPRVELTGHPRERVAHIASFIVGGAEGEALVLYLSEKGICAASGSACTSEVLESSHVLTAMGVNVEKAHGSLRFSLGKETTREEIDYVIEVLPGVIERLREMAPEY